MIDAIRAWWLTGLAMLSAGFLLFVGVALIADPDTGQGVSDRAFGAGFLVAGVVLSVGLIRLRSQRGPAWIAHTLIVVGVVAVAMFWWLLVPGVVALVLIYAGVIRRGLQRELLAAPTPATGGCAVNAVRIMAVAAAILLLHACGDDAEALSKPEFIEQADAICESTNAELDATFDQFFADMDAEFESDDFDFDDPAVQDRFFSTFAETMKAVEPILDRQLDGLRALRPPDEDRDMVETLLDDLETVFDEFADRADAAAAGDESARGFLDGNEDPFADVNARAQAYGLVECGDPGE